MLLKKMRMSFSSSDNQEVEVDYGHRADCDGTAYVMRVQGHAVPFTEEEFDSFISSLSLMKEMVDES